MATGQSKTRKMDHGFLKIQRKNLQKELEILRLGHMSQMKQIEMYRKQFNCRGNQLGDEMRTKQSYLNGSEIGFVESMIDPDDLDRLNSSPMIYNRIKSADKRFKSRPESGRTVSGTKRRVQSAPTRRDETETPFGDRRTRAEFYSCHRPKTAHTFFARKNNEEDLKKFRDELILIEKSKRPELQNRVDKFCKIFANMKENEGYFNKISDMNDVVKVLDGAYFRVHQRYPVRETEELCLD